MSAKQDIWFVYDGECPICQLGAFFYKVKQSVGVLHTIDARTEKRHPVMQEVNRAGLDVDEGMVIKYQGKLYQGDEALHIMATLGADTGLLNKLNNALFKSQRVAVLCYPYLKMGRNLALKLKSVKKIENLRPLTE